MASAAEPAAKRPRVGSVHGPRRSWVEIPADSDFSIANIPFGIFSTAANSAPRAATAIGNYAVDLAALAAAGLLPAELQPVFASGTLNAFMERGRPVWRAVRERLQALFAAEDEAGADAALRSNEALRAAAMVPLGEVTMHLPASIGDYTDFYSSREHATNVGSMFRPTNPLMPNWLHLPVGYHGRSSTVVVTGTDFRRPCGQLQKDPANEAAGSVYGPSKQLDFELELGAFVGRGSAMGEMITMDRAEDHIFGFVLLNDWSARDVQKWEYVPLGPFGAKNFCTTISPWIVTLDALEPFRCESSAGPVQADPAPLPYLQDPEYARGTYDINLTVALTPAPAAGAAAAAADAGAGAAAKAPEEAIVSRSNYRYMYWNAKQQLVHHTVTGCAMRAGDLLGSGTISGTTPDSYGSMLELAWRGTKPLPMPDGTTRSFLADGDTITMRGWCERDGVRVGFGACAGKVLPATPFVAPAAAPAAAGGAGSA